MTREERIGASLAIEVDGEDLEIGASDRAGYARGYSAEGSELTLRVATAAEDGHDLSGPLSWLNSARLTIDPSGDRVIFVVSIGDPRGGFAFEVCRAPDGKIRIFTPHAGESLPHIETRAIHAGTLELAGNYADAEAEESEEP